MMIMQILAAITPHCPQATCSLNISYMSSDYVGRIANLPESVFDSITRSFCKQIKIFSIFLLYFFDFFFAICNYHVIFAALFSTKITKTVT